MQTKEIQEAKVTKKKPKGKETKETPEAKVTRKNLKGKEIKRYKKQR